MQDIPAVIGTVEEGSAGAEAGLVPGDRIVRIAGQEVDRWKDVAFVLATSPERPVEIELVRGARTIHTVVTPSKVPRYEFGDAGIYPRLLLRFSEIFRDSPAHRAGFKSGDEVRRVDEPPDQRRGGVHRLHRVPCRHRSRDRGAAPRRADDRTGGAR